MLKPWNCFLLFFLFYWSLVKSLRFNCLTIFLFNLCLPIVKLLLSSSLFVSLSFFPGCPQLLVSFHMFSSLLLFSSLSLVMPQSPSQLLVLLLLKKSFSLHLRNLEGILQIHCHSWLLLRDPFIYFLQILIIFVKWSFAFCNWFFWLHLKFKKLFKVSRKIQQRKSWYKRVFSLFSTFFIKMSMKNVFSICIILILPLPFQVCWKPILGTLHRIATPNYVTLRSGKKF